MAYEELLRALNAGRRTPQLIEPLPEPELDTPPPPSGPLDMLAAVPGAIGGGALDALGAVGGFLDSMGGKQIRRGLVGENPFGDVDVSGRDMLERWGIAPENKPGLFNDPADFFSDVGGFALEVGLDPWTYMGLGGLTKAGKAAQTTKSLARSAAGHAADDAARLTDAAIEAITKGGPTIDAARATELAAEATAKRTAAKEAYDLAPDLAPSWGERVAKGQSSLGSFGLPGIPFLSDDVIWKNTNLGMAPETAGKVAGAITAPFNWLADSPIGLQAKTLTNWGGDVMDATTAKGQAVARGVSEMMDDRTAQAANNVLEGPLSRKAYDAIGGGPGGPPPGAAAATAPLEPAPLPPTGGLGPEMELASALPRDEFDADLVARLQNPKLAGLWKTKQDAGRAHQDVFRNVIGTVEDEHWIRDLDAAGRRAGKAEEDYFAASNRRLQRLDELKPEYQRKIIEGLADAERTFGPSAGWDDFQRAVIDDWLEENGRVPFLTRGLGHSPSMELAQVADEAAALAPSNAIERLSVLAADNRQLRGSPLDSFEQHRAAKYRAGNTPPTTPHGGDASSLAGSNAAGGWTDAPRQRPRSDPREVAELLDEDHLLGPIKPPPHPLYQGEARTDRSAGLNPVQMTSSLRAEMKYAGKPYPYEALPPVNKKDPTQVLATADFAANLAKQHDMPEEFVANLVETYGAGREVQDQVAVASALVETLANRRGVAKRQMWDDMLEKVQANPTYNARQLVQDPATGEMVRAGAPMRGSINLTERVPALIKLYKAADSTTWLHEMWHATAPWIDDAEKAVFGTWLEGKGIKAFDEAGRWTTEGQEATAKAFEEFLHSGRAASPELQGVFERLAQAFRAVYKQLRQKLGGSVDEIQQAKIDKVFNDLLNPKAVDASRVQQAAGAATGASPVLQAAQRLRPPTNEELKAMSSKELLVMLKAAKAEDNREIASQVIGAFTAKHGKQLYTHINSKNYDKTMAASVWNDATIQQANFNLWNRIGSFDPERVSSTGGDTALPWAKQVFYNTAIDEARKRATAEAKMNRAAGAAGDEAAAGLDEISDTGLVSQPKPVAAIDDSNALVLQDVGGERKRLASQKLWAKQVGVQGPDSKLHDVFVQAYERDIAEMEKARSYLGEVNKVIADRGQAGKEAPAALLDLLETAKAAVAETEAKYVVSGKTLSKVYTHLKGQYGDVAQAAAAPVARTAGTSPLAGRLKKPPEGPVAELASTLPPKDSELPRNRGKWIRQEAEDGSVQMNTKITTSNGSEFFVHISEREKAGLRTQYVDFIDEDANYSTTRVNVVGEKGQQKILLGNAIETVNKVSDAVLGAMDQAKPDALAFTADGKSRVKLYDQLARRLMKERAGYVALKQGDEYYAEYKIVKKEHVERYVSDGNVELTRGIRHQPTQELASLADEGMELASELPRKGRGKGKPASEYKNMDDVLGAIQAGKLDAAEGWKLIEGFNAAPPAATTAPAQLSLPPAALPKATLPPDLPAPAPKGKAPLAGKAKVAAPPAPSLPAGLPPEIADLLPPERIAAIKAKAEAEAAAAIAARPPAQPATLTIDGKPADPDEYRRSGKVVPPKAATPPVKPLNVDDEIAAHGKRWHEGRSPDEIRARQRQQYSDDLAKGSTPPVETPPPVTPPPAAGIPDMPAKGAEPPAGTPPGKPPAEPPGPPKMPKEALEALPPSSKDRVFRKLVEDVGLNEADLKVVAELDKDPQRIYDAANTFKARDKNLLDEGRKLGITRPLEDGTHFYRSSSAASDAKGVRRERGAGEGLAKYLWTVIIGGQKYRGRRVAAVATEMDQGRQAALTGWREGTVGVNDGVRKWAGMKESPEMLRDLASRMKPEKFQADEHLKEVAAFMADLDPGLRGAKAPNFFDKDVVEDMFRYQQMHAKKVAGASVIHRLFADVGIMGGGPGTQSLANAMSKAGLKLGGAGEVLQHFLDSNADLLGTKGVKSLEDLKKFTIPDEYAAEAIRFLKAHTDPEYLQPFLGLWDGMTEVFKTSVTVLWPANWVRNAAGGQFNNWIKKAISPTAMRKGWAAAMGEGDPELMREMEVFGVIDPRGLRDLGSRGGDLRAVGNEKGFWPRYNRNRAEAQLPGPLGAWEAAGSTAAGMVEAWNRATHYIARKEQGWAPYEAARSTLEAQFDYSKRTSFEKQFAKRLVPFWTFSKHNLPFHLEELLLHPGGRLGQSIRAANVAREDAEVPAHLAGKVVTPIGLAEDGTSYRYLSGLGLPFEEAFERFDPGSIRRTTESHLGMLNPLIKAPLELLSGRQFHTGRDLADLQSYPTGIQPLDQAIFNSPVARGVTTARTLADERKGPLTKLLNVGTGVKLTDVDLARTAEANRKDEIRSMLESSPNIRERKILQPRKGAELSPEERELLAEYQGRKKKAK